MSLDTETTGVDLYHGAKPFLVTTCNEEGDVQFWEWDVDPFTRQPSVPPEDLEEIEDLINKAGSLVLQNTRFDVAALNSLNSSSRRKRVWQNWPWNKTYDTLLAGHLLNSSQPHDLTTMALVYLDLNIQPYEDEMEEAVKECRRLVGTKEFIENYGEWSIARKDRPDMPSATDKVWKYDTWLPRAVAKALNYPQNHIWWNVTSVYANMDSSVTLPLYLAQQVKLQKLDLWKIYEERLKILPSVYSIESQGISLSRSRLQELKPQYEKEEEQAASECIRIASKYKYDLEMPKGSVNGSLKKFAFEVIKLPVIERTETGQPSLNKNAREVYALTLSGDQLEFVKQFGIKSKRSTGVQYMTGYERYWRDDGDGEWHRLHAGLNPTGTGTLRFSSSDPNMQNVSKKEDSNLRYIFGPAPGREWWTMDYENIELRIPAYESKERTMIEIFEKPNDPPYFGGYHLLNASIIYPELFWPLAEQKGEFKKRYASTYYQWIKNFGFAVGYGAVPESGTADTAAHKPGAQLMVMNQLKEHTKLNQSMIAHANKHGYVETLPDKTVNPNRGYPLYCSRSAYGRVSPTIPLNYHVQGTAMWCTMKAMIRCHNYLATLPDNPRIIMQVHDEIVFDLPYGGKKNLPVVRRLKQLMEQSGEDISIPLRVSVGYHPYTWKEEASLQCRI